MTSTTTLSRRGLEMLNERDFLDQSFLTCLGNPYNEETNNEGYVNLGTAMSALCEDVLLKRLNDPHLFEFSSAEQHYFAMWGIPELRKAMADFLTTHLTPNKPVKPENMLIVNGGVTAMEVLACTLMDPGDVLLTPTPCYTRIFVNFAERFKVQVKPVVMREKSKCDDKEDTFSLTADLIEETIIKHKSCGENVRAFLMVNPNNPLGEVYPPFLVRQLMSVCHRHAVHFIADEAYALSIYEPKATFESVLSLQPSAADPERTHVIWAFSKDISLAGLRLGVLMTWNTKLLEVVHNTAMYTAVPAIVQRAATRLLQDKTWLDEVYFPTHRQRLQEAAQTVQETLTPLGVTIRPAQAGFFLWVKFLHNASFDDELDFFKKLMSYKVYINPGSKLKCMDPGWFRMVFSTPPENLNEGLKRIVKLLNSNQQSA